jgi:hypothetical protein
MRVGPHPHALPLRRSKTRYPRGWLRAALGPSAGPSFAGVQHCMRSVRWLCLGLLAAFPAQSSLADRLLPASALQAADAGSLHLGFVLARFGVPTGIVTTENPSNPEIFKADASGPPALRLGDVVARFAARHPGDTATLDPSSGRLTIEGNNLVCARQLDALPVRATTATSDLSRVLVLLSWIASGEPPPGPAGTMSFVGNKAGAPPAPALPPVRFFSTSGMTLRMAFDQAIGANHGGVWIVWQHTLPDGRTGCRSAGYYSDGVTVGAATRDFWVSSKF